jgi:cytochrome P450
MTQTPPLRPLHMRRTAFDPTPQLREIRESTGVGKTVAVFGMPAYLVTRHDDIKEVLADPERFSNSRPSWSEVPGAPVFAAGSSSLCLAFGVDNRPGYGPRPDERS